MARIQNHSVCIKEDRSARKLQVLWNANITIQFIIREASHIATNNMNTIGIEPKVKKKNHFLFWTDNNKFSNRIL